jgi:hypothetical protein
LRSSAATLRAALVSSAGLLSVAFVAACTALATSDADAVDV